MKINLKMTPVIIFIVSIRVWMRFLVSIDRKIFQTINRFGSSFTATCRSFKANDFKHYCAAACAGTSQGTHAVYRGN